MLIMIKHYTFKTLYTQIKSQKSDFWSSNVYGVVATLMLLPIPILVPLLIDEILLKNPGKMTEIISSIFGSSENWVYILVVLLVVLILRFSAFFFTNRSTFYSIKITTHLSYLMRYHVLNHLQRVSISEYETLKPGGIASNTIQDVERISGFAGRAVVTLFTASVMLVGIAVVMLWMNWILAILVFVLNPIFLTFSKIVGRKTGAYLRRQNESYELYNEIINETLELFIQVRASNQESNFFVTLKNRAKDLEKATFEFGYKSFVAHSASGLLTNTVVDIFRVLAIATVAYSNLSIGMMIAFLFYLSTLTRPIQQLSGLVIEYQSVKPAMERINTLFALEQEPKYPQEINPFENVKTTSITLQNISFSYSKGKEILHNINIQAEAGKKIALIGSSGSGKTTIAQIMVGFYSAHTGKISYGNAPINQIGLPVIRENVALMLQHALFFNDSIRMNLTLSRERSDKEIYEALKASQLESFVDKLEDGLETIIGKNGIRLSGGQRQRLAIARLILSNPKIIIFDEATSALDNETEFNLYETLTPFLEGKTTIIIAHRTTTIKQADYIYLIEDGKIKAEGSYETLQEQNLIREDFDA